MNSGNHGMGFGEVVFPALILSALSVVLLWAVAAVMRIRRRGEAVAKVSREPAASLAALQGSVEEMRQIPVRLERQQPPASGDAPQP